MPELIESISKPAERTKTWPEYRDIFITNKRIAAGVLFAKQNNDIINRAVAEMGVPRKILLGILGVETYFGRIQGSYKGLRCGHYINNLLLHELFKSNENYEIFEYLDPPYKELNRSIESNYLAS